MAMAPEVRRYWHRVAETEIQKLRRGKTNTMRKQKGFSLIELLIVVAIILIIAAIAIPNLLRAKISANESSAVGSVRNIVTGMVSYNASYQYFAPSLASLGPASSSGCTGSTGPTSSNACLIDFVLASGLKSGYAFGAQGDLDSNGNATAFTVEAYPQTFNSTGVRAFCAGEDGVLRVNTTNTSGGTAGAVPDDPWSTTCVASPWTVLQ
jgi:type IV pilus assembly protein PilA